MLGLGVTMDASVWMEVREDEEEYSTWYRSCSDTKIKNKKKKTYLCKDKIPLAMVSWSYLYTHIGHMFILI